MSSPTPGPPMPGPPMPGPPMPGPPHGTPEEVAPDALELPEEETLAAMPVGEHVALFEDLHARLADQLDDAGA